jgi:hypothetical protein
MYVLTRNISSIIYTERHSAIYTQSVLGWVSLLSEDGPKFVYVFWHMGREAQRGLITLPFTVAKREQSENTR